jgi:hypothetical protein
MEHKKPPSFWRVVLVYLLNCQIVKWLKSPNGANIESVALTEVVLNATGEILVPRVVVVEVERRRTPIVAIRKTTNIYFF